MGGEIRCVVVGYGPSYGWGHRHAEWIERTRGLSLHGICDIDADARSNARKTFGDRVKIFPDFEDVLADDEVDLVSLVTPHDTHAPLAIRALQASKHVLTDKVMCLTTAEADTMIRAAKESGRMLSVFQNRRFDSDFLTVQKVIQDGWLGDVFLVESSVCGYDRPSGWRAMKKHGGGVLYDWGAHLLDQALQLIDSQPKTVFADVQKRVWDMDVETFAKVIIRFENGCIFEVDLGNVQWSSKPRWRIFGENGTLRKETLEPGDKARVTTSVSGVAADLLIDSIQGDRGGLYGNISAHLNEGAQLLVEPDDVRKSISLIEAAFESAESGKSVSVN